MMLVRFKQAAEAVVDGMRKWVNPGTVGEIPDEHYDAGVHEDLTPAPAAPVAPADPAPTP